jgi:hypothetical protein
LSKAGLKHIAVGAAVPKELDQLDFSVARFGGQGAIQGQKVFAGLEQSGLSPSYRGA